MDTIHFNCIRKIQNISTVNQVVKTSRDVYQGIKSKNICTMYVFLMMERTVNLVANGVSPIIQKFEKPLGLLDNYACATMDNMQFAMPAVVMSASQTLKSMKEAVLQSSLIQQSLTITDRTLLAAEKALTSFPNIEVEEVTVTSGSEDNQNENVATFLSSSTRTIQYVYSVATFPLRIAGQFIHHRRRNVQSLQEGHVNKPSRKRSFRNTGTDQTSPGLLEKILFFPVQILHTIGDFAQKRTTLQMMQDPDIDVSQKQKEKEKMLNSENINFNEFLDVSGSESESENEDEIISSSQQDYDNGNLNPEIEEPTARNNDMSALHDSQNSNVRSKSTIKNVSKSRTKSNSPYRTAVGKLNTNCSSAKGTTKITDSSKDKSPSKDNNKNEESNALLSASCRPTRSSNLRAAANASKSAIAKPNLHANNSKTTRVATAQSIKPTNSEANNKFEKTQTENAIKRNKKMNELNKSKSSDKNEVRSSPEKLIKENLNKKKSNQMKLNETL